MGNKGLKEYTKICTAYDTKFENFKIPVGALYGRCKVPYTENFEKRFEYVFWACIEPQKTISDKIFPVYIFKPSWASKRWKKVAIGQNHIIARNIFNACTINGGVPVVTTFKNVEAIKARRDLRSVSCELNFRKHPTPQCRCYKQAQVDGKNWCLDWEEEIQPMQDIDGYHYNALPIQDNGIKQAPFSSFEGVTDTIEARRRNGMKVNQTKCRPEKKSANNSLISVKINGYKVSIK